MDDASSHRKRNKKHNIEGHAHFLTFSCHQRQALLTNDLWRQWLAESVSGACRKHSFDLWAYVFMPEHVHLLLKPRRGSYDVAAFEHDLKLSSARRILAHLKETRSPLLDRLRIGGERGRLFRFWQVGGGHDLNVWTMAKAIEKARYCHRNPVKRRLVRDPVHWRWSSFRWLELGKTEGEPLVLAAWDESLVEE